MENTKKNSYVILYHNEDFQHQNLDRLENMVPKEEQVSDFENSFVIPEKADSSLWLFLLWNGINQSIKLEFQHAILRDNNYNASLEEISQIMNDKVCSYWQVNRD